MASRKTPAQKKADKKDWYAVIETRYTIFYYRTSEKHYTGIDSECGVKVTKDVPSSGTKFVTDNVQILRERVPVIGFNCEAVDGGGNYTVYRRVNPEKIVDLFKLAGDNSLKMNGTDPVKKVFFPNQK